MNSAVLAPPAPARRPHLLVAALLACYLIWGSTYLAIRLALVSFPPFFQMGTRFLTAGVILFGWTLLRGGKLPGWREWRNALVIGALMLGGGMGLCASAEQYIGSGLIAAFIAVTPLLVAGWGLLLGQRPGRLEFAGMAVGLAGVVLLASGASFSAAPAGIACIAGATLAWSLGSVLSAPRGRSGRALLPLAAGPMGFASEMLCGGAVLMLISLALGEQGAGPLQAGAVAAWLYLVVFGSLIAFSAYLYLLANASPAMATSYALVNPVIALFLGVVVAGEAVSSGEWLACGVIVLGVFLIFRGKTA